MVHNGVAAFAPACDALQRFRAGGGTVMFITNAPRPGASVRDIIDRFGVPRDCYDSIVSSGEVTRGIVAGRPGQTVFHLGPKRDLPIFTGLDIAFAGVESADYVVCSGLFDDTGETPEDYRPLLSQMRARSLFMVCANPDVVVERGHELVYCAGAIADLYAAMGGEVLYCGKPHAPIYRECLERAAALRGGVSPPLTRVLAIGDSVRTDLTGAAAFGLDALFVISGTACRTARRARGAGSYEPSGDLRRSRRRAEGGHAKARVVMSATGSGAGRRGAAAYRLDGLNTASILAFRVWALNGLTM